jgi:hypothetical protein
LGGVLRNRMKVREAAREKIGILFSQSLKPFSHLFSRCVRFFHLLYENSNSTILFFFHLQH